MTLCLGPVGSGKTLLLKKLQNVNNVNNTSTSVPTVGTNMFTIRNDNETFLIRELGGAMAPLWSRYFNENINKIIYVVDASNLCQISAAGVLLYTILVDPVLKNCRVSPFKKKKYINFRTVSFGVNKNGCELQTNA